MESPSRFLRPDPQCCGLSDGEFWAYWHHFNELQRRRQKSGYFTRVFKSETEGVSQHDYTVSGLRTLLREYPVFSGPGTATWLVREDVPVVSPRQGRGNHVDCRLGQDSGTYLGETIPWKTFPDTRSLFPHRSPRFRGLINFKSYVKGYLLTVPFHPIHFLLLLLYKNVIF